MRGSVIRPVRLRGNQATDRRDSGSICRNPIYRLFVREFLVYSRRGCHLCEELLEELEPLCRGRATISVRDVDTRDEWVEAYGEAVPVLVTEEREICRYHLDREAVLGLLGTQQGAS